MVRLPSLPALPALLLLGAGFPVAAQQTLPNGETITGSLTVGFADTYSFYAEQGDTLSLSMADTNADPRNNPFWPQLSLYRPDSTALRTPNSAYVTSEIHDLEAPVTGTYTVRAEEDGRNTAGNYEIRLVRAPGANQGGVLPNGGVIAADLTIGDLDSYTFYARQGETLSLTMADTNPDPRNNPFWPQLSLYLPDGGTFRTPNSAYVTSGIIDVEAPATGTYTVMAREDGGNTAGDYEIRLVHAPGANEGGVLPNGQRVSAALSIGDLDSYTFFARQGETLSLAMADTNLDPRNNPFWPQLSLYAPDGDALRTPNSAYITSEISDVVAPATGTYTVMAREQNSDTAGTYDLQLNRVCNGACTGDGDTPPGLATPTAPVGTIAETVPSFSWNAVSGATWYYLWIQGESLAAPSKRWYTAAQAGCANGGSCSISPGLTLGGASTWWVLAWNRAGNGPWSSAASFSSASAPPPAVQLVSPSGGGTGATPTFRWRPAPGTSWYRVWINLGSTPVHERWYRASDTSCATGTNDCTLASPVTLAGAGRWWVQGWSASGGHGPWGAGSTFAR